MAQYTAIFTKPYEDGYENLPSQNTPITAETLNDKDTAIEHIEDFLDGKEVLTPTEKTDFVGAVSDIEWYENNGFLSRNLFKASAGNYYPSGISYVVNDDGTVTVNGYNSGRTYLAVGTISGVSDKTVRLTGCPSGGNPSYSETGYCMFVGGSGQSVKFDSGEGLTFVPDGDSFTVYINVVNTQMDNVVFKPMVSLDTSTTYNDFTPYAQSNNALDAKKADISAIGTDESERTTASRSYTQGEHFYKDGKFGKTKTAVAQGATWTLNTNYVEGTIADELEVKDVTSEFGFNTDCSWNTGWTKIYKYGKLIKGYIRFSTPSTMTSDKIIISVPTKYKSNTATCFLGTIVSPWTGQYRGCIGFSGSEEGIRLVSTAWATDTAVVATFEYLMD